MVSIAKLSSLSSIVFTAIFLINQTNAFVPSFVTPSITKCATIKKNVMTFHAKKRKNQRDIDTFNNWYDKVDTDATPDDIFWEEMERQKLLTNNDNSNEIRSKNSEEFNIISSLDQLSSGGAGRGMKVGKREEIMEQKNMEAMLNSFWYAMVPDNFLGDNFNNLIYDDGESVEYTGGNDINLDEENKMLDQQLDEMTEDMNDYDKKSSMFLSTFEEPWDSWGQQDDGDLAIKIEDKGKFHFIQIFSPCYTPSYTDCFKQI